MNIIKVSFKNEYKEKEVLNTGFIRRYKNRLFNDILNDKAKFNITFNEKKIQKEQKK